MQQKTQGRKGATARREISVLGCFSTMVQYWVCLTGVSATIVKRSGNGTLHIKANREWVDEPMPTDL
eukprot:scaffold7106_cov121-Cylindrotheca_fusiformis.AAC.6